MAGIQLNTVAIIVSILKPALGAPGIARKIRYATKAIVSKQRLALIAKPRCRTQALVQGNAMQPVKQTSLRFVGILEGIRRLETIRIFIDCFRHIQLRGPAVG